MVVINRRQFVVRVPFFLLYARGDYDLMAMESLGTKSPFALHEFASVA
jgi:hypothetical protein